MTSRDARQALSETLIRTPAWHIKVAVGDYPDRDASESVNSIRFRLGEPVASQLENEVEDHVIEAICERFRR